MDEMQRGSKRGSRGGGGGGREEGGKKDLPTPPERRRSKLPRAGSRKLTPKSTKEYKAAVGPSQGDRRKHYIPFIQWKHRKEYILCTTMMYSKRIVLLALLVVWMGTTTTAQIAEDKDIMSYDAYASETGRKLLASCSKSTKYQYYGTKRLLEEIDITGKNGQSSCCWYCRKTCGCRKWDYTNYGNTEICKLYEPKAPKKIWKGCEGCTHVSGKALNK